MWIQDKGLCTTGSGDSVKASTADKLLIALAILSSSQTRDVGVVGVMTRTYLDQVERTSNGRMFVKEIP